MTPTLTEAEMQKGLMQAARQLGFLVYHTKYSIGSERGYPDLHVVGYGREFFWEIKGPKPTIYPEQERWIAELQACGHNARFVHPEDYDAVMVELMNAYAEAV